MPTLFWPMKSSKSIPSLCLTLSQIRMTNWHPPRPRMSGDSKITFGVSCFNELTYYYLSLRQYLNQTSVQKYQMPSLVQTAPEVILSTGFYPVSRVSYCVPHSTGKYLNYLLFWLGLLLSSTGLVLRGFRNPQISRHLDLWRLFWDWIPHESLACDLTLLQGVTPCV